MPISRRHFIRNSTFLGVGFAGLKMYACTKLPNRAIDVADGIGRVDYGPLLKDTLGILDLPEGFTYRVISRAGDQMQDGLIVPGAADGMGTFLADDGRVIIVRNHELTPGQQDAGPFPAGSVAQSGLEPADFYDYGNGELPCLGGTTTVVYSEETGQVESQFASLLGTIRNCAGGITPWGSWLTCEEDVTRQGSHDGAMQADHGYVFEVPATATPGRARPVPIIEMGRFNHEAVAVNPATGIVYLTEDRHDGLFYRFIPTVTGKLNEGGRLQALMIDGSPSFDTRNWPENETSMLMSTPMSVGWVDISDVTAPNDDLRSQGWSKGAAVFARGEGVWYGDNELYFACTSGGQNKAGQLFKFTPSENGDTLELFIEPNNTDIMKSCDNLTIAPNGDVLLCEDHPDPFIRGVTPQGNIFDFAHNTGYQSEFAGVCFSPSGKTMFVNIQGPGLTIAIAGPWKHLA